MPMMRLVDIEDILTQLNNRAQEAMVIISTQKKKLSPEQIANLAGKYEAYNDAIETIAKFVGLKVIEASSDEEEE